MISSQQHELTVSQRQLCLPFDILKHLPEKKKQANLKNREREREKKKNETKLQVESDLKSVLHTLVGPSPRTPRGLCASLSGARWPPCQVFSQGSGETAKEVSQSMLNAPCHCHQHVHPCTYTQTRRQQRRRWGCVIVTVQYKKRKWGWGLVGL